MGEAYRLACQAWPSHSHPCSRHDYTLPQLFACLVVREMLRLSYRRAEALLRDSPPWLADVGLARAPDHNTLWRAFGALVTARRVDRMLDLLAELFAGARRLGLSAKPLTVDSTCYEPRHRSRHYDRACRKAARPGGGPESGGKWAPAVNRSRSAQVRRTPKLALAVAAGCHLILAARAHTGGRSDSPDFDPLLFHAWRRAAVRTVVADAGYDSERNHRIARLDMAVRSVIPARIGRPTARLPTGRFRRLMRGRFARKADARVYGQRAQSETVNSMMKRNFGDALRSTLPGRRKKELLLRALTHNLMLC